MPFARLTVAGIPLTPSQQRTLAADVASLVVETLRKDPTRTAVLVELPAAAVGLVGGAIAPPMAHLEVLVTAGSNTVAEKRAFVAGADALLRRALGPLPEATYAAVRELAGDAWGYAGRTQSDRRREAEGTARGTPAARKARRRPAAAAR